MQFSTTELEIENSSDLAKIDSESVDVLILNTFFDIRAKSRALTPANRELTSDGRDILSASCRALKKGGLLFVYGLPQELPLPGEFLNDFHNESSRMVFKYWIALDIDNRPGKQTLQPSHLGLLMYLKTGPTASSPFHLNTKDVRITHNFCTACGQNVKDWGGKKHLMNPIGICVSDVWRDFKNIRITSHLIPPAIESRIVDLTKTSDAKFLKVRLKRSLITKKSEPRIDINEAQTSLQLPKLEIDKAYQGDCVSFLQSVSRLYPDGIFDMVFADPPYNLGKNYSAYADTLAQKKYIEWCNDWLLGMARTLKPGGALFVLNLPKWCIHHATFLQQHLEFRHWIVWDALSDPRGKIMPAHYALLYYTKPGGKLTFNYKGVNSKPELNQVASPDSPTYCLRNHCVKARKKMADDKKVELSDIWFDIHRIKHKRDRDAHPCQLPEKLMERLILLSTNPDGIVFDPFCGAGTTAIASTKLGRHFVVTDLDSKYVQITEKKIAAMKTNADLFGHFAVPRTTVKRDKQPASKKEVEVYLQKLALKLDRVPTDRDVEMDNPSILTKIDLIYPNRSAAFKRSKVAIIA